MNFRFTIIPAVAWPHLSISGKVHEINIKKTAVIGGALITAVFDVVVADITNRRLQYFFVIILFFEFEVNKFNFF